MCNSVFFGILSLAKSSLTSKELSFIMWEFWLMYLTRHILFELMNGQSLVFLFQEERVSVDLGDEINRNINKIERMRHPSQDGRVV